MSRMSKKMECRYDLPTPKQVVELAVRNDVVDLEPFIKRREVPLVTYKLDDTFILKGEQISYNKGTAWDVVSIIRKNRGDDSNAKPFTLSIPMRMFDNFNLALQTILKLLRF